MEEGRSAFKTVTGKSTGKTPLGRPRGKGRTILDRMNLKEIGINTSSWADLDQDRDYWRALVNAALNLRIKAMKLVS